MPFDPHAPAQDHMDRAEHSRLKRDGGRPVRSQGYVLSRWDRHSAHHPLTRAERRYLRDTKRPAKGIHANMEHAAIRLCNPFGAVIKLFPQPIR